MATHVVLAREPRRASAVVAVDRSAEAIAGHLEDAAHFPGGHADGIARPRSEAEVAFLLQLADRVLPIGAQSSVTGGATPDGGLLLSTDRLTTIQDSGQDRIRAGAGISLDALQKVLRERRAWYAPVPTFTGAFVGGVVATNAAGAATFKYGTTRAWVEGLTVVLACGHVLDLIRGEVRANGRVFDVVCPCGTRRVTVGAYRMPEVPKCSAGYFAAPDMDLVDLFVGSEGTLGIVLDATLRVASLPDATLLAAVPAPSDDVALALVAELRRDSQRTWRDRDACGIDVAAIEYLDRRCLELVREDGADRKNGVAIGDTARALLLVQLELPPPKSRVLGFDSVADAIAAGSDNPLARFCRLLERHGVFDDTQLAMPGDERRVKQLLALREAAPTGVNRRVGDAKRDVDARIEKTAADMIVPFEHLGTMLAAYRAGYESRGLDYAIWGHVSDGNVHPNVIPRSYADIAAGKDAILDFGRRVAELGGCPLAEHGVGRSPLKQTLLRQLYGDAAIAEMQAIKQVLDPDGKLAPGVIIGNSQLTTHT